jgi:hypothetical protein
MSAPASQVPIWLPLQPLTLVRGLQPQELPNPAGRPVEHSVEHRPVERMAFGRALHLNEMAVAVHRDVHVHVGAHFLIVAQIGQRAISLRVVNANAMFPRRARSS